MSQNFALRVRVNDLHEVEYITFVKFLDFFYGIHKRSMDVVFILCIIIAYDDSIKSSVCNHFN